MTPAECKIVDAVRDHIARHGYSPSLQELARLVGGKAKGWMHTKVERLIEQGYLVREARRHRSLVLPDAPSLASIPTDRLAAELERRRNG